MSTEYYNSQWQMPNEVNKNKQANYSLNFNGSSYIDAGNANELNITESITISAWVKASSSSTDRCYVSKRGTSGDAYQISQYSNKAIGLSIWIGGSRKDLLGTTNHVQDVWYHVVGTYDGSYMRVYVNGVEENNQAQTGSIDTTTNSFRIAADNYSSTYWFNGQITEVCIFDYALSASQVETLYGTGSAIGDPMSLSTAPQAYYPLSNSIWNGSNYITPNNAVQDYVFNDKVRVTSSGVNLGNTFTISWWFKNNPSSAGTGSSNGSYGNMIVKGQAGSTGTMIRFNTNRSIQTYFNGTTIPFEQMPSNMYYGDGYWHMMTFVRSANTAKMYIDNNLAMTKTGFGTDVTYFNGTGDNQESDNKWSNVLAWNTALSDGNVSDNSQVSSSSEMQTLYNNGSPIKTLANIPQNSNLKVWYKLDASEIYNSTSTEWSVENNASPTTFKSALNFDGTDDYIDVSNVASDLQSLNTLSISFWANNTQVSNYNTLNNAFTLITGTDANKTLAILPYDYYSGTGNNDCRIYYNGANIIQTGNSSLTGWNHFCYVQNGATDHKVYINGVSVGTSTTSKTLDSGLDTLRIGGFTSWGQYFDGSLSNVAIYNTALSASNITTLYNNGVPQATIYGSPVSHWKLDNTTTGIQDSAGSNNGTNNGATEVATYVNTTAGESSGMSRSNLIQSNLSRVFNDNALSIPGGTARYAQTLSGFYPSSGNFTFSVWLRNTSTGRGGIFSKGTSFQASEFGLAIAGTGGNFTTLGSSDNGKLIFMFDTTNAPSSTYLATSEVLESGKWYNFVATYTSGDLKLYLNGSLDNSTTSITKNTFSDQRVRINNCLVNGWNFTGQTSNWAFFDTVLSATEVKEIWNNGLPGDLKSHSKVANLKNWIKGAKGAGNQVLLDYVGSTGFTGSYTIGPAVLSGFTDLQGTSSGFNEPAENTNIASNAPYSDKNVISYNIQSTNSGAVSNTWTTPTSGRTTETPQAT